MWFPIDRFDFIDKNNDGSIADKWEWSLDTNTALTKEKQPTKSDSEKDYRAIKQPKEKFPQAANKRITTTHFYVQADFLFVCAHFRWIIDKTGEIPPW